MPGLRLTRPSTKPSAKPTLMFPVQAVRALPEWAHRGSAGLRLRTPEEIEGAGPTSDLVDGVGVTIARMQAQLDEMKQKIFHLTMAFSLLTQFVRSLATTIKTNEKRSTTSSQRQKKKAYQTNQCANS